MFDALKAPNLPRFARITAVEVASHRRGDNSTVEYEVVTTVADTSGQLHEVSSFHRHSRPTGFLWCRQQKTHLLAQAREGVASMHW